MIWRHLSPMAICSGFVFGGGALLSILNPHAIVAGVVLAGTFAVGVGVGVVLKSRGVDAL